MAKARLFLISFLFLGFNSYAASFEGDSRFADPAYHQIASIEVLDGAPFSTLASTEIPKGIGSELCTPRAAPFNFTPAISGAKVWLDIIINIGRAAWELVKANRAKVDIRLNAGTATPQGLGCWTELQQFSDARSEYKTIVIRNFLRMKAVEFTYRMVWLPGGRYNGKGKYIGYATMIPSHVYVIAGWTFDAQATMPAVFNQGSSTNPVGAINMNMVYRAESHFSTTEQSQSYQIDGEGRFLEL